MIRLLTLISLSLLMFSACQKEEALLPVDQQEQVTALVVSVIFHEEACPAASENSVEHPVQGMEIALFEDEKSFHSDAFPIAVQTTSSSGTTRFENLELDHYFIHASGGFVGEDFKEVTILPNRVNNVTFSF